MNKRIASRDISYTALCSVLFIICSWISVPTPVPFTLQSLGVVFASLAFGKRRAFFAVLVYLLIGIIGFPVFSGFRSGIATLTGPTGGYVIGMLFLPIIIGSISEDKADSYLRTAFSCLAAMLTLYIFGTLWYLLIYTDSTEGILSILSICVFPFIIPDVIKCAIAAICAKKIRQHIQNR